MEAAPNTIEVQASRWAVRLDAGPLTAEERAALETWVAADRRHHGALVRARAAWLDADRLAALSGGRLSASVAEAEPREQAAKPTSRSRRMLAVAAVILLVVAAAAGTYISRSPLAGQTYASEIGEVRNIRLPDGSELTLNTNTLAAVRFREHERDVSLTHGEALFKVAHDTRRPFIVYANDIEIKAVGTAFMVRVDDARVDVTVTEGTVEVTRPGTSVQRLSAGQRALVASGASRTEIQPVDDQTLDRQLAWREGMLSFAGEPLSSAVAEINRYSRKPIYIDSPALAAQPVIGIFHASDAAAFAAATAATFNADVVEDDGAIHLRERSVTQ
jgi:transmembrane sensor